MASILLMKRCSAFLGFILVLTACVSANPSLVAQSVSATLTAAVTPTPIVIVVTALGGGAVPILSVTPDLNVQQTLAAATQTLIAGSVTPGSVTPETASPSATLKSSPEPTQRASPSPTASSIPSAASPTPPPATSTLGPPPPAGNLIFTDDFSQPNLWSGAIGEDDLTHVSISEGQLAITLKVVDYFAMAYDLKRRAHDFYAVVTGAAKACRFRDRYGLLFHLQSDLDYYQFDIDCDGRYRFSKMLNGNLMVLKDWTASDFIRVGGGAVNQLGVRVIKYSIEVFANNQPLFKITDSTYQEGGFGLYAGSGISAAYTATFDDLEVREVTP